MMIGVPVLASQTWAALRKRKQWKQQEQGAVKSVLTYSDPLGGFLGKESSEVVCHALLLGTSWDLQLAQVHTGWFYFTEGGVGGSNSSLDTYLTELPSR